MTHQPKILFGSYLTIWFSKLLYSGTEKEIVKKDTKTAPAPTQRTQSQSAKPRKGKKKENIKVISTWNHILISNISVTFIERGHPSTTPNRRALTSRGVLLWEEHIIFLKKKTLTCILLDIFIVDTIKYNAPYCMQTCISQSHVTLIHCMYTNSINHIDNILVNLNHDRQTIFSHFTPFIIPNLEIREVSKERVRDYIPLTLSFVLLCHSFTLPTSFLTFLKA